MPCIGRTQPPHFHAVLHMSSHAVGVSGFFSFSGPLEAAAHEFFGFGDVEDVGVVAEGVVEDFALAVVFGPDLGPFDA